MNKQRTLLFVFAFAVIAGTALGMHWLKANQKLGKPGVKAVDIAGSSRMNVYLPEQVLDYDSVIIPTDTNVLNGLPQDTSFIQRRYRSSKDELLLMNIVLMGSDRTSIHKPQFCLTGSGWNIDAVESSEDTLRIENPAAYDLSVMKLIANRDVMTKSGEAVKLRGIYVYWFVADNDLTASHGTRMWKTASHLLHTGELERWAYVSCFAVCAPGQERVTYERMKKFITAATPQFQLAAGPRVAEGETLKTASR